MRNKINYCLLNTHRSESLQTRERAEEEYIETLVHMNTHNTYAEVHGSICYPGPDLTGPIDNMQVNIPSLVLDTQI